VTVQGQNHESLSEPGWQATREGDTIFWQIQITSTSEEHGSSARNRTENILPSSLQLKSTAPSVSDRPWAKSWLP